MSYSSLRAVVDDLERTGQLVRVTSEVDPHLELAEIQRRLYKAQGPAVLFENVKGSPFPMLVNLYGTLERTRYLFRESAEMVQAMVGAQGDPASLLRQPHLWPRLPGAAWNAWPRKKASGAIDYAQTNLAQLPQLKCWPDDGGAFITLPQVCTLDPEHSGILHSNLGMYRVQISGNDYEPDECGLHYQIHRGIGIHHASALRQGKSLKVSIFVGGPPAHTLAAVMPLPEGLPELAFAGLLAGHPFRYALRDGWVVSLDADFCILGEIQPDLKNEGPFGDHLGFYSLKHPFPYLKVRQVLHRRDAIWPCTVVGRPPQEDTSFGAYIHEITRSAVPSSLPGIREVHAVDAAGVHPLLLVLGSERYVPYATRYPQELLTQANAVLGFGQLALAKFLLIAAHEDVPDLSTHNIPEYFGHVLSRIDFSRDLHFQTRTHIDTLDYSGESLNQGSKLVLACAGPMRRSLGCDESDFSDLHLPAGFSSPRKVMPGVLAIQTTPWTSQSQAECEVASLTDALRAWPKREQWPWISVVDDADWVAHNLDNWLWVTFTRTNPSHDVSGVNSRQPHKHWACEAPLVCDARRKTHHAPPLIEDPAITHKVDAWFQNVDIRSRIRLSV